MPAIEDLRARRAALVEQLLLEMAVGQGHDVSEGLSPYLRGLMFNEASLAYEDWCERAVNAGAPPESDGSPIQDLLARLYAIDNELHSTILDPEDDLN
jgi:hypothetical protein